LILGLDEPAALDPGRAGAKAASLAAARQSGLPILPGFVVEASAAVRHMEIGAAALALRGSGGARLAVMAEPIPGADEMVSRGRHLGDSLIARSSSLLEGSGGGAGAFASFADISSDELPKAVVGCWASAFSVDALARQRAAGVEPGTIDMAVLVQPAIQPVCGGVAELEPDGSVVVHAVAGSPVSLLQGWERGVTARLAGERWAGEEAVAMIGEESLKQLASLLGVAAARFGVNRCEWGVSDRLWLLQLGTVARSAPIVSPPRPATPAELVPVVQAMMAVPGALDAEPASRRTRVGVRSWEPLVASVVLDQGTVLRGIPAASGIGAGLRHHVDLADGARPPRRAVVAAIRPLPNLSQLLWDAAGLVTGIGSPAAHVFEAARSLGVPAVCGVELPGDDDLIVAVDGYSGLVATLPLSSHPSP
jgi:pyruvate,water dikinase